METRKTLLNRLNDTVTQLRQVYRSLPDSSLPVYELWSAKDILAHLTFWHESFARNVDDLVNGRKPSLLKGRLRDLNLRGVDEMAHLTLAEVLARFEKAHATIQANVLNPALTNLRYRQGSREYTAEEHIELVNDHINAHLQDVRKVLKG